MDEFADKLIDKLSKSKLINTVADAVVKVQSFSSKADGKEAERNGVFSVSELGKKVARKFEQRSSQQYVAVKDARIIKEADGLVYVELDDEPKKSIVALGAKEVILEDAEKFLILDLTRRKLNLNYLVIDSGLYEDEALLQTHLRGFKSGGGRFEFVQTQSLVSQTLNALHPGGLNAIEVTEVEQYLVSNQSIVSIKLYLSHSIPKKDSTKGFRNILSFIFREAVNACSISKNTITFDVGFENLKAFYDLWGKLQNFIARSKIHIAETKRLLGFMDLSISLEIHKERYGFVLHSKGFNAPDVIDLINKLYHENENILREKDRLIFYNFVDFLTFLDNIKCEEIKDKPSRKRIEELSKACGPGLKLCKDQEVLQIRLEDTLRAFLPNWIEGRESIFQCIPTHSLLFDLRVDSLYAAYIASLIDEKKIAALKLTVIYKESKIYIAINDPTNPDELILGTHISAAEGRGSAFPDYRYNFCEYLTHIPKYRNTIFLINTDQNDYRICIAPQYEKEADEYAELIREFLITLENFTKVYDTIKSSAVAEICFSADLGYHLIDSRLFYLYSTDEYIVKFDLNKLIDLRTKVPRSKECATEEFIDSDGKILEAVITFSADRHCEVKIVNNTVEIPLKSLENSEDSKRVLTHLEHLVITAKEIPKSVVPLEVREKKVEPVKKLFLGNFNFNIDWSSKLQAAKSFGIKNKLLIAGGVIGGIAVLCIFVSVINNLPSPFNGIVATSLAVIGVVFVGICYKNSHDTQSECQKS